MRGKTKNKKNNNKFAKITASIKLWRRGIASYKYSHWGAWYSERGGTPSIMGSYKPIPYVTSLVNHCDAQ
jgi:hypothetical protein